MPCLRSKKSYKGKIQMKVKIHKDEKGRTVIAVCDSNLLGKRIEEGNRQLDLTSDFYKGQEKTKEETGDLMRNAYIINIIGEESVKLAIDEGLIDKKHVIRIAGIPHAECISVDLE
ncbi:DUF424 family protein [Candidatus Woesearchaeota archaeon]|nr:DUF424 family protein [Candidatus Woesearchaeota archaeon]